MQRKTIEQGNMTLQEMLRQLRKDAGKYQEDIAKLIGVKSGTYSAYETGRIVPSADKLYALAKYYDISADMLLSKLINEENLPYNYKSSIGDNSGNSNDGGIAYGAPNEKASELQKVRDDNKQLDELVYYYKNLTLSQKKVVYDLAKTLYSG
ncbi:helix-turn-helix domain-containing protein [Butyrivibrio sp. YAB3001]|uniref:helix-turn-helix domain-containing protein n=1 Tax=Butyrivibrio sp. YAB3001 TaxID=1520812 RepID=UPI0008F67BCC|nr:helix-turn-helix transcriptional regulator [Butyrivibrio sp. YAB3001]SFD00481.1 Helix-turn-helix domain-containing protein [Butyrivibrio sp. YAB3001]